MRSRQGRGALDRTVPVTSLRVKSVIATPLDGASACPGTAIAIRGAAWSGEGGPVTSVDVSVDGGQTGRPRRCRATSEPTSVGGSGTIDGGRCAARHDRRAGSRRRGSVQPLEQQWNPSGYGWNVMPRVTITVGDGQPAVSPASGAPPRNGRRRRSGRPALDVTGTM